MKKLTQKLFLLTVGMLLSVGASAQSSDGIAHRYPEFTFTATVSVKGTNETFTFTIPAWDATVSTEIPEGTGLGYRLQLIENPTSTSGTWRARIVGSRAFSNELSTVTGDYWYASNPGTITFTDYQGNTVTKSFSSVTYGEIFGIYDAYFDMPDSVDGNIARWLGVNPTDTGTFITADIAAIRSTVTDTVRRMYSGTILENGKLSLGLERISQWKVNPDYVESNLKQHAGYAAEVVSTAKENLQAKLDNTGVKTYRADDRPDLFPPNDQYVDKIRIDSAGNVEKVQVKFVGEDAKACLAKLKSADYDKYFQDGAVDKIEVPKDYYDDMKQMVSKKISSLEEQVQHVKEQGKTEAIHTKEAELERCRKIDKMLELYKDYIMGEVLGEKLIKDESLTETYDLNDESTSIKVERV